MQQVEGADVQRGGHRDPGAARDQALGELEPRDPVVQAPVDVRRGHIDQPPGAGDAGHLDDDAHRERGGLAPLAAQEGPVALGELDRHRGP
jgi:hypothetical protein